jgi:hypothetical protein
MPLSLHMLDASLLYHHHLTIPTSNLLPFYWDRRMSTEMVYSEENYINNITVFMIFNFIILILNVMHII